MNLLDKAREYKQELWIAIFGCAALLILNTFIELANNTVQEWFRFFLKLFLVGLIVIQCFIKWKTPSVLVTLGVIVGVLFLTPVALVTFFILFSQLPGYGYLEELYSIPLEEKSLVVYQNNCGATCAFGLEVTIEKYPLFGLLQTQRIIYSYYPGNDLILEKNGLNSVKVISTNIDRTNRQQSSTVPSEGEIWDLSGY